jgi:hypothetical protein
MARMQSLGPVGTALSLAVAPDHMAPLDALLDRLAEGNPLLKELIRPHVESSLEQYQREHPGASPQDFVAAVDRGVISASDMGLYPADPHDDPRLDGQHDES